ncbi:hypothetical protein BJ742DRAFT_888301 [Cladochytrium replicatum]|nr:hypothetical protein BJ742DRAFT_888301 [Cladochytrium replicatum]
MNRTLTLNRAQSLASDQEINDSLAEIELQKLQRQYRIMEGDRKAYSEESRILISKQRGTIEKLKRDNQHLLDEVKLLEQRNDDRKRNGIRSKKAEFMADQAEMFQKKLRQMVAEIETLNLQIASLGQDIDAERADLGGVHAASQNCEAIAKQIRILENRLDKALVKFSKSLAVNKRMRGTIDNLRRERLVFDNIYRKFERELTEQKKQMAEIIEMSNAAYEARDEAQAKIIALKEKAEKEYQAYVQEMKELDRVLEQDRRLKDFMAAKAADRMTKLGESTGGSGTKEDSSKNKSKEAADKDAHGANKFPSQETLAESLEYLERAFTEIRKVTGISDITELVQRFKAVEDQNFSLFNYVNEVNNEIEKMAEEIVEIQKRIDEFKVENVALDEERTKVMRGLEETLESCTQKLTQYNQKYNDTVGTVGDLRNGIERLAQLFQTAQLPSAHHKRSSEGDGEEAPDGDEKAYKSAETEDKGGKKVDIVLQSDSLLGAGGPVTDTSLIPYLGLIEHKTNDILTIHYLINTPKKGGSAGAPPSAGEDKSEFLPKEAPIISSGGVGGLLGLGPTAPLGQVAIIAPNTGEDHDSDDNTDEDERPLTREELKQRTLKGLSKREKAGGQAKVVATKAKRKSRKGGNDKE